MGQFMKEYLLMIPTVVMLLLWIAISAISHLHKKKWLYITQMTALFANIVYNMYLVYYYATISKPIDICLLFVGWAAMNGLLLLIELKSFYERFYN